MVRSRGFDLPYMVHGVERLLCLKMVHGVEEFDLPYDGMERGV